MGRFRGYIGYYQRIQRPPNNHTIAWAVTLDPGHHSFLIQSGLLRLDQSRLAFGRHISWEFEPVVKDNTPTLDSQKLTPSFHPHPAKISHYKSPSKVLHSAFYCRNKYTVIKDVKGRRNVEMLSENMNFIVLLQ